MSIIPALLRRRRGSAGGSSAYLLAGRRPTLVADFKNNYYAVRSLDVGDYLLSGLDPSLVVNFRDNTYLTNGRELMTAYTRHGLITSGRSTTMIVRDSDGIYKHGAHNLYRNGAGGAQAITVVSGRDYTIRMKGTGSIGYSGAATGTLSGTGADDVVRVEVTATTTTLTVTPSGSTSEIAVYQSDLGGMQLTSDGTDYVENNTGAALYAAPVEYDVNGVRSMPIWEARTNSIRNPVFAGATAGVVGSGGVAPTNMTIALVSGVDIEIIGTGTEDGLPYIELDFSGTGTGSQVFRFEATTGIVAATSQAWSSSYYTRLVSGTLANVAFETRVAERTLVGSLVSNNTGPTFVPSSEIERQEYSLTLSGGATVARVDASMAYTFSGAVSFRLRVYAPQMEQGLGASPFIPAYGSTATRAADNLYTLATSFGYRQTEGTIVAEFESVGSDGADFPSIAFLHDGSADNRIALSLTTGNGVYADARVGAVGQMGIGLGSYTPNGQSKAALGTKQDSFAGSLDGATVATDSSGSHPSGVTTLQYGRSDTGQHLNGKLYSLAYYPFRASNADLEAASA